MPVGCPGREVKANSQSRSSSQGRASSHVCTQPQTHAYRSGSLSAPMSARAVAVIRPAQTIISLTRVPFHPVWPRPIARLSGPIASSTIALATSRRDRVKIQAPAVEQARQPSKDNNPMRGYQGRRHLTDAIFWGALARPLPRSNLMGLTCWRRVVSESSVVIRDQS